MDFSALFSAVKPKDRTPQYLILAALFTVGAHREPVTAKQITALFKLHCSADTPTNIPASLRKYQALVTPAELGPPIKWKLTDKGLDRLRTLSGLALRTQQDPSGFKSDLGIVCALEFPELAAVLTAFGRSWQEVENRRLTHVYRQTELLTSAGSALKVIATTSTSMGLTAAAIATTQLITQFSPKFVLMIGIAAGTRSGGKEFGDVLVADPSVDYNSGKVVFENGVRGFQPDPYPIGLNPRLRSVLQRYRGEDELFRSIRSRWTKSKLPARQNRLFVGPVGAADQVIDDASRVLEIQQNWRKLIGVEMEAYGVYRAAHEAPEPKPRFASFKAVCDFAAEKSDSWQEYAAYVAAQFAMEFIKREWENLWPQED